jgi:glutathione peroxidase
VRKIFLMLIVLVLGGVAVADVGAPVYNFKLSTIDGDPTTLGAYKGKVLLVVNVASACGFTPQYTALEAVYEKYKDKGLVIVGVPANNFGNQESGTNATIKEFCSAKFHVKFPMMAKVSVKGDDKTPLYQYLTAAPNVSGEIKWNFTKFLIARNGQPIARFEPAVTPDSPQVISAIESALKP